MSAADRLRGILERWCPDPAKRELIIDGAAQKIRADYVQGSLVPDLRAELEACRETIEIQAEDLIATRRERDEARERIAFLESKAIEDIKTIAAKDVQILNLGESAGALADRVGMGEVERRQLGLPAKGEGGKRSLLGVEISLENDRATVAKFRNLKKRVVEIAVEVDRNLDELDAVGRKNVVTKEDVGKLREIRDTLRQLRGSGSTLAR